MSKREKDSSNGPWFLAFASLPDPDYALWTNQLERRGGCIPLVAPSTQPCPGPVCCPWFTRWLLPSFKRSRAHWQVSSADETVHSRTRCKRSRKAAHGRNWHRLGFMSGQLSDALKSRNNPGDQSKQKSWMQGPVSEPTLMGFRRSSRIAHLEDAASQPSGRALPDSQGSAEQNSCSVALKPGLQPSGQAPDVPLQQHLGHEPPSSSDGISGLWSLLPEELIETILNLCTVSQLGMLQSTCTYFRGLGLIGTAARHRLKAIPRARGLKPRRRENETHLALLHFVNYQSAAAAQATAIACGGHHTAALFLQHNAASSSIGHAMYTFGRNFHGQLGLPDQEDVSRPSLATLGFRPCQDSEKEEETMPAVVACGTHHSTCISRRGELFSWGFGRRGELGHGDWTPLESSTPKQCPLTQVRIVSVACGTSHTLAIGELGSLWSCGHNSSGQLGHGHQLESQRLQTVQNLTTTRIVSAAAGVAHSMALASDGSLFTWGDGSRGQLGHSSLHGMVVPGAQQNIKLLLPQKISRLDPSVLSPENRVTATAAGSYHSVALTVGGSILSFGGNDAGCLGLGDQVEHWKPTKVTLTMDGEAGSCLRAVQLACGSRHTVALVSKQGCMEVRTAGINTWGQLGLGDRKSRSRFTPVPWVEHATAVQAGEEHSAAVTEDGSLYVWGRGDSGQLGLGDWRCRRRPTLLHGFTVVHPDKTLRRSKRNQPHLRLLDKCKRQQMSGGHFSIQ